jgi:hypothetical protein
MERYMDKHEFQLYVHIAHIVKKLEHNKIEHVYIWRVHPDIAFASSIQEG